MTKKKHQFKQISFSVSFFQDISSLFHVLISQNFVIRSMMLDLCCTCETYLSTSSQVLAFSDRTENVQKFDRFQIVHVSYAQKTQTFQCHGTITVESNIPLHNMGSTKRSDHLCVCVSRVRNDDHCVVHVHVLEQKHFQRTHLHKSLLVVVLKWNV